MFNKFLCGVLLTPLFLQSICFSKSPAVEIPTQFSAHIGGFDGESYWVNFDNGKIIYEVGMGFHKEKKLIFNPSEKDWQKFDSLLDESKIWSWEEKYPNPGVYDGTQWDFKIEYKGRKKEVVGDNAYPAEKEFKKFKEAIKTLIQGKRFG